MQIHKSPEVTEGRLILLYSETGVGKTTTTLQTSPEPILYIQFEERSVAPSLSAVGREIDVDFAPYTNYTELLEFVNNDSNFERYTTVIADGITHLSNIALSGEIEDQTYDSLSDEDKAVKPLIKKTKMSMEGWGGLAGNLFRFTRAMGRQARLGKIVIMTALLKENPKYDRTLAAAPDFKGKEYPNSMPGFFDLIGKLSSRVDDEGCIIYPPFVEFDSPDNDFLCKFTGVKPGKRAAGLLNVAKIVGKEV